MANQYELKIDTAGLVVGVKAAAVVLGGLEKVLGNIGDAVKEAFAVKGYADYKETVKRFGKDLADDLLVLQLNFGKMKVAIADAVAPIAAVFVPWLNTAVRAVTDFARTVGSFLGALFGAITGNDALAASAENAAQQEENLASSVTSAGKALRRSLMSFDQLQRLSAGSGSSSASTAEVAFTPVKDTVSPQIQAVVDKILALIEPLRRLDFSALLGALANLQTAFHTFGSVAGAALEWLWYQVITPFLAWVTEVFAPTFTEVWASALTLAAVVLEPVMAGLQNLWAALEPVVNYIGSAVIAALQNWQGAFEDLGTVFAVYSPQITGILTNIGTVLSQVWSAVSPVLTAMQERFGAAFGSISQTAAQLCGAILEALYGVSEYLAGVFTGDWQRSWEGIKGFLKGIINGVIGLLNTLLNRLCTALNSVISAANKLRFKVPDWVPGIGGNTYGFNMSYVSAPQIPYLAKGAVLPANKPFLAMVGDQKHGTNIEAPLTTIQEAVSVVMEDQTAAILAGFEASIGVQKEILEAVLGISIGDDVIGAAAARYSRKQAVMLGGVL